VDSDPQCIAQARAHNLPVVEEDVVEYLRAVEPASLDAIFSAHMVEHMPYATVLETIQLAHRALKPGGRLLLVTPNPRALISHLELYPLHFAHIAMYHPKLLAFFMDYAGFAHTEMGENPHTMPQYVSAESPLRSLTPSLPSIAWRGAGDEAPPKPSHPIRRLLWYVKMGLAQWLVRTYFDQTRRQLNELASETASLRANLNTTIEAINRPFECYVIGDKA
jgi:SAM-dependent methyltransferase